MTQEDYRHPITPPPELVQQWTTEYTKTKPNCLGTEFVANRAARRPKPPSLKEQALALLNKAEDPSWDINDFSIVRRALEQLPE